MVNEFLSALQHVGAASAKFAHECGPTVLQRTHQARIAAEFYREFLSFDALDLESSYDRLKRSAADDQRGKAKTMLRLGLLSIPHEKTDDEDREFWAYQIAVYTIVLTEWNLEKPNFFAVDADPFQNKDLAWCIQILASHVFGHDLWKNN